MAAIRPSPHAATAETHRPTANTTGSILYLSAMGTAEPSAAFSLNRVSSNAEPSAAAAFITSLPPIPDAGNEMVRLSASPTGRYLAVTQPPTRGSDQHISIIDLEVGQPLSFHAALRDVPPGGRFAGWHPDGQHALYIDADSGSGLWQIDVTGKGAPLHLSTRVPDAAAISPDDGMLAIAARAIDRPVSELWLSQLDGSAEIRVLERDALAPIWGLSWSPDGTQLLYMLGAGEIWISSADGSAHRLLSANYAGGWAFAPPAWSPDGESLVFPALMAPVAKDDIDYWKEAHALHYVTAHLLDISSGKETPLLTGNLAGALHPAWSPDGQALAFVRESSDGTEIWTVAPDGPRLTQVTGSGAWHSAPVWIQGER